LEICAELSRITLITFGTLSCIEQLWKLDQIMAAMPLLDQRMDLPGIREIDACD
jgi:hypothetical protein